MKMLLIFAFIASFCAISFGQTNAEKFDVARLSPDGQKAYQKLLGAERFEEGLVGFAAQLSDYVTSFNKLLDEKAADSAFKSLLANASTAGKLYALSGLYYTDHKLFKTEIEKFRRSEDALPTMSGCLIFTKKVSEIVESKQQNVAIIAPDETFENWTKTPRGAVEFDILNGGFPAVFRYYGKTKR